MKTFKRYLPFLSVILIILIISLVFIFAETLNSSENVADNSYTITNYSAEYDYKDGRTFEVTETITVTFNTSGKHGIIRDLPLNSGEVYSDVTVSGESYSVTQDSLNFLSVYIGNENVRLPVHSSKTYTINYNFTVPEGDERDSFYINVLGSGWATKIENFYCKITFGAAAQNITVSEYGSLSSSGDGFTITATNLSPFTPITIKADFAAGTLSAFLPDGIQIAASIIAILLLVAAVCACLLLPKNKPLPVVNFNPPEGMDPLQAGTLIDGKADNSDVTAMFYYWAANKNIEIDFSNENDPVFKLKQSLPSSAPQHQKDLFDSLFLSREKVASSKLSTDFANSAQRAKKSVEKQTPNVFSKSSKILSTSCAVIAVLIFLITIIVRTLDISSGFSLLSVIIASAAFTVLPVSLIYLAGHYYMLNKYKSKRRTLWILLSVQVIIAIAFTLGVYFILPQTFIFGYIKIILSLSCMIIAVASPYLLRNNKKYAKALGPLLGFRQFILLAEKDRLEKLIEENPEYYYEVLPYALVLGVSDVWNDKFKDINLDPPQWAQGYNCQLFNCIVFTAFISRSMQIATRAAAIRPPSGMSGGFGGRGGFHGGGGFGGGGGFHGGGGFGGGGGRSW